MAITTLLEVLANEQKKINDGGNYSAKTPSAIRKPTTARFEGRHKPIPGWGLNCGRPDI